MVRRQTSVTVTTNSWVHMDPVLLDTSRRTSTVINHTKTQKRYLQNASPRPYQTILAHYHAFVPAGDMPKQNRVPETMVGEGT
jgi:hypothetical protein